MIGDRTLGGYRYMINQYLQKQTNSIKSLSFRIPLIQSQQLIHENLALSCADLKLYVRSTCIHNSYLQRYFRSNRSISYNASSFQTLSIVTRLKYDIFHILTENYTLGGHVQKTGICKSTLGRLKMSTIATSVFKLLYQYQHVFYGNMIVLHTD